MATAQQIKYGIWLRSGKTEPTWLTEDGEDCEVTELIDNSGRYCLKQKGRRGNWIVWEIEPESDEGPATYHCYYPSIPTYELAKLSYPEGD